MLMHMQTYFSSSKLTVMESVVVTIVVKMQCLEKVITNLETVIWEKEREC